MDDQLIQEIIHKIDVQKKTIQGAQAMRRGTNNPAVQASVDQKIQEAKNNIQYFEERLHELQMRKAGQGMGNMSLGGAHPGQTAPQYQQGAQGYQNPSGRPGPFGNEHPGYGDNSANYGDPGNGGYSQLSGGQGMMPPRAPYAPPAPSATMPKSRPNYSKLDLVKYDTHFMGPRIQMMLSQLEFKLSVENQYKEGIEKMLRLYSGMDDKKSRADAQAKRTESTQKIHLLKSALKRYEGLHVDMESSQDVADDDSINQPNMRRPLTGHLSIRIHGVKGVDHAATSRFARGPETFVVVKVEDVVKIKTKSTRNDRWTDENHDVEIDKANEVEFTVYDKAGESPLPIGMLWIRISDIAEEMRRKKIESEFTSAGWVSAGQMESGGNGRGDVHGPGSQTQPFNPSSPPNAGGPSGLRQSQGRSSSLWIDSGFSLEPAGQILLSLSFVKQAKDRKPFDIGLGRKGAVRQRKEEVHEMYGHKFVPQQFYSVMRCALCEKLLKYAVGMQCTDCKYTCHRECYTKVVTKCISKSNAETDPTEQKLNHRIPHRFEGFSNMGANWCCHCGYMLPFGRKNAKKCTDCGLTCHAQCAHLVPDFCGMTMEKANELLRRIKEADDNLKLPKMRPTMRPGPSGPPQSFTAGSQEPPLSQIGPRKSSLVEPFGKPSSVSSNAAAAAFSKKPQASPPISTQGSAAHARPQAHRTPSEAAMAAAAALAGKTAGPGPTPYQQVPGRTQPPGLNAANGGYDPRAYVNVNQGPTGYNQSAAMQQQQQQQQQQALNTPQYAQPPVQQPSPLQTSPQNQQGFYPNQLQPAQSQAPQPVAQQQQQPAAAAQPPARQQGPRIGLDHFNFLAVLGKGNFGKVMLAETKSTKKLYAIKVLKKEFIIENDEVESTRSEKRVFLIANQERHPFLLNLHACFQTETRVYFVMEYISGGDLMLHIQRGQFGTKRAQFYAAEVCLALKYFHENGVIYRDLKLDNILLTLDGHIKIADYGLCKEEMYYGATTTTFCGTPEFMAPEILLEKRYGRAVDWWAFGVLIYQMLLQQSPFRGEDEDEIYDAILSDEPLYPIHMPRDSVSILQKLLTREPDQRLGSGPTDAQEIMSHSFFRNINWDDIYLKKIGPPFQPSIKSATDTSNFDSEFTSVTPVLTPVQSFLTPAMQEEFRGFSYTADFA